jgi:O-antigen/teichoic acid export membrane protein
MEQGMASAIALCLTLVAGRQLGAEGLGTIVLGMAIYLFVAGLHRALVVEPLLIMKADSDERENTSSALTACLVMGLGCSFVLWTAAALVRGPLGEGMRSILLWVPAALLVDFCRSVGFRDARAGLGLQCHGVWLVVMALGMTFTADHPTVQGLVGCWGVGAVCAVLVGLLRIRYSPASPKRGWRFLNTAWRFSRWLVFQNVAYGLGIQGSMLVIGLVAGPSALGTFKAMQTVFAPLTFLLPAINLSMLSPMAKTFQRSTQTGRDLASRLNILSVVGCVLYLVVVAIAHQPILELLFGQTFGSPLSLIVPISIEQLVIASSVGFFLTVKVLEDGPAIVKATVAGATTTLVGVLVLGSWMGVVGAAWACVMGSLVATLVAAVLAGDAVRSRRVNFLPRRALEVP